MLIDNYTKIVLTIIAAALVSIAFQGTIRPASAQMGDGCGSSSRSPCYVEVSQSPLGRAFKVEVQGR